MCVIIMSLRVIIKSFVKWVVLNGLFRLKILIRNIMMKLIVIKG